jgi:hypothetical protein
MSEKDIRHEELKNSLYNPMLEELKIGSYKPKDEVKNMADDINKHYPGYAVKKLADEIIKSEQHNDKLIDVTVDTANNALSVLAEFVNGTKQPKIERIGEKISLLNDVIATSNSSRAALFQAIVDDLNRMS